MTKNDQSAPALPKVGEVWVASMRRRAACVARWPRYKREHGRWYVDRMLARAVRVDDQERGR